jgi:hypothetical protein
MQIRPGYGDGDFFGKLPKATGSPRDESVRLADWQPLLPRQNCERVALTFSKAPAILRVWKLSHAQPRQRRIQSIRSLG